MRMWFLTRGGNYVYHVYMHVTNFWFSSKCDFQAENQFISSQARRQEKQRDMAEVQQQIREVHTDLDKTRRSDDRYLDLLTQEHGLIKDHKALDIDFKLLEKVERDNFSILSQCLRDSHEKERARAERTKYWSLIGSAVGALIGILGTTINNSLRMRELKNLVRESTDPGKINAILGSLTGMIRTQQSQIRGFLHELKVIIQSEKPGSLQLLSLNALGDNFGDSMDMERSSELVDHFDSLSASIRSQEEALKHDMLELKGLIAADHADKGQIVYVGPQLEDLLHEAERNLEWKMKINTLASVVAGYGIMALLVPFILAALAGGGGGGN